MRAHAARARGRKRGCLAKHTAYSHVQKGFARAAHDKRCTGCYPRTRWGWPGGAAHARNAPAEKRESGTSIPAGEHPSSWQGRKRGRECWNAGCGSRALISWEVPNPAVLLLLARRKAHRRNLPLKKEGALRTPAIMCAGSAVGGVPTKEAPPIWLSKSRPRGWSDTFQKGKLELWVTRSVRRRDVARHYPERFSNKKGGTSDAKGSGTASDE